MGIQNQNDHTGRRALRRARVAVLVIASGLSLVASAASPSSAASIHARSAWKVPSLVGHVAAPTDDIDDIGPARAACTPATSVVATSARKVKATGAKVIGTWVADPPGPGVKVTVRLRVTTAGSARATVTADMCPGGVSSPATRTLAKPWAGIPTKTAAATGKTRTAAVRRSVAAARKAAVKTAKRHATKKATRAATRAARAASAAGGSTTPGGDAFKTLVTSETIAAANQARTAAGVNAVTGMQLLTSNAGIWAQHMADTQTLEHSPPASRIPPELVSCLDGMGVAEIILVGYSRDTRAQDAQELAQDAVESWLNSPGHRYYMLNAASRRVGVGVGVVKDPDLPGYDVYLAMHLISKDCLEFP